MTREKIIPYKQCAKYLMYQGLRTINQTISNREKENIELTDKIIEIHEPSHKRYGAPKVHVLLKRTSYTVG